MGFRDSEEDIYSLLLTVHLLSIPAEQEADGTDNGDGKESAPDVAVLLYLLG